MNPPIKLMSKINSPEFLLKILCFHFPIYSHYTQTYFPLAPKCHKPKTKLFHHKTPNSQFAFSPDQTPPPCKFSLISNQALTILLFCFSPHQKYRLRGINLCNPKLSNLHSHHSALFCNM